MLGQVCLCKPTSTLGDIGDRGFSFVGASVLPFLSYHKKGGGNSTSRTGEIND